MANKQLIKMYLAVKLGISMTTSSFSLTAFSIIEDAMKMKRGAWKNGQVQNLYGRFFFLAADFCHARVRQSSEKGAAQSQ